jgi:hypothetical protein
VRNNDPSILPEHGEPLRILDLSENEGLELAGCSPGKQCVTYLKLNNENYTKVYAEHGQVRAKQPVLATRYGLIGFTITTASLKK